MSKKMPMVKKGGKMVPAFAADGKGKMMAGGKATKGRAKMSTGGRTVSRTDASTAKSTPPNTGKDASRQRIVNSMVRLIGKDGLKGLSEVTKEAKERAKTLKGPKISPSMLKGPIKEYKKPERKKAYGGKTKKK